jgi:hypothetical protein
MALGVSLKLNVFSIPLLEMPCEYLQYLNFDLRKIVLDFLLLSYFTSKIYAYKLYIICEVIL